MKSTEDSTDDEDESSASSRSDVKKSSSSKAEYVANIDYKLMATVQQEMAKKQLQQKQHYFLLQQLQNMSRELPGHFQQRLPYDLLSGLANALIDGTVFEIVRQLRDVQQLEERNLFNQRMTFVKEQKSALLALTRKQKDDLEQCERTRAHHVSILHKEQQKELQVNLNNSIEMAFEQKEKDEFKRRDMRIITKIDGKVIEQQSTLEKAGVPGFFVTNNQQDIRLQMHLLDFIQRLSSIPLPTSIY